MSPRRHGKGHLCLLAAPEVVPEAIPGSSVRMDPVSIAVKMFSIRRVQNGVRNLKREGVDRGVCPVLRETGGESRQVQNEVLGRARFSAGPASISFRPGRSQAPDKIGASLCL